MELSYNHDYVLLDISLDEWFCKPFMCCMNLNSFNKEILSTSEYSKVFYYAIGNPPFWIVIPVGPQITRTLVEWHNSGILTLYKKIFGVLYIMLFQLFALFYAKSHLRSALANFKLNLITQSLIPSAVFIFSNKWKSWKCQNLTTKP